VNQSCQRRCGVTKELSGQMPPDCGNYEHHEGVFMKIDRHGKAKILSQEEIQLLFNEGLTTLFDRCLFGICLYTACRINEACTLRRTDVFDKKRNVRPEMIIRTRQH